MKATTYLHSTKEQMYDLGLSLGLVGDALHHFMFALSEVKFEIDIDEKTGIARILLVNDRVVEKW